MIQSLHYGKIPHVPKIHVTFEYLWAKASENVKYKAINAHAALIIFVVNCRTFPTVSFMFLMQYTRVLVEHVEEYIYLV